jgi:hypothetical protein
MKAISAKIIIIWSNAKTTVDHGRWQSFNQGGDLDQGASSLDADMR